MAKDNDIVAETMWLKMDKDARITDNSKALKTITYKDINNLLKKCNKKREDIKAVTSNCKTVGENAFSKCKNIDKIVLVNCTEIKDNAFEDCTEFINLYLPKCNKIGENVFKECTKVKDIILKGGTDERLGELFPNCKDFDKKRDTTNEKKTWWLKIDKSGYITDNSKMIKSITKKDVKKAIPDGEKPETSVKGLVSHCKTIGKEACKGFTHLKKVNLPDCTEIEDSAFYNCTNLEEVKLSRCRKIKDNAFRDCIRLKTVVAPKLEEVEITAFMGCKNLKILKISKDMEKVFNIDPQKEKEDLFTDDMIKDIEKDGEFGFDYTDLKNLYDDDSVKKIGSQKFTDYTNLETVNFKSVWEVGGYAFSGCKALQDVSLPGAKKIGGSAFRGCESLSTISLPKVENIGIEAFYNCKTLKAIDLPTAYYIANNAFSGCVALESAYLIKCESIPMQAFYKCKKLTDVNFQKVGRIGEEAFNGCIALKSVDLPICTSIGRHGFKDCSQLTSLKIPGCTRVDCGALSGCSNLSELDISSLSSKYIPELFRNSKFESNININIKISSAVKDGERNSVESYLRGYYPNATIEYK